MTGDGPIRVFIEVGGEWREITDRIIRGLKTRPGRPNGEEKS